MACLALSLVTTGLDPVVHDEMRLLKYTARMNERPCHMDCRVKPGNDEIKIRSRDASAPELCHAISKNDP
jgi:hypothetical protein